MSDANIELATLGGGCFWCLEAVYEQLRGVVSVRSGYAGGHVPDPSYERVCMGTTGHAEVVQVAFDPGQVTFRDILQIFFTIHDPTTPNRQGPDVGTQYRSVIFTHSDDQRTVAEAVMTDVDTAKMWNGPLVTEVTPLDRFYPAEAYHQEYFRRNQSQPYCQMVVAPKVVKFRKQFIDRLKTS